MRLCGSLLLEMRVLLGAPMGEQPEFGSHSNELEPPELLSHQHQETAACPRVAGVLKGNITQSQWDAEMGDTGTRLECQKLRMLLAGCLKGNLNIHVGFRAPE